MGLRDIIAKALGYKLGVPTSGPGIRFFEMQAPPGWGYQSYLKAYGEIGWLFSCVNVIAQAVSRVNWHLYELDKDGERTELTQHELIDLFNHMNPFQSRYQFMYLGTMYKLLVGEQFWQLNFNGGGQPAEIWLAPPAYMTVVPSEKNYIDHYEYRRTGMEAPALFTIDEIIHIKTPNPFNEYRGLSPAQALTVTLDSQRYAQKYNQKLFFNDATPGFVLEYPAENMPPAETRKELVQEWDERFRGFRNRGKTAFLWGAKANTITMTNRDMDFATLLDKGRDEILGAYHVPRSILGITEDVNRANAEAAQYTFAQYCVLPELSELREALNKELVPFFGDNLYLDFENPVPEDEIAEVNNSVNLFKAKIITRNEARIAVDMEALDTPEGEEFFTDPVSNFGQSNQNPFEEIKPPEPKQLGTRKKIFESEEQREGFWKDYVSNAESYEAKTIFELQSMYLKQKEEALVKFEANPARDTQLLDLKEAHKQYVERITPILMQVMAGALKNGNELVKPPNPHKDGGTIPPVLNQNALKWLRTRIGWAASQISEETASRLSQVLADGYERGLSVSQIADNIKAEFDYFSDVRTERIARTEIMQASAEGTREGYQEAGVTKVEFYAALDERACDDCMALHKEIFTLDDSEGVITVHPQCRCVWLPVVE